MSTKISQLTAATTPTGPESVPIVQSGTTVKATISEIVQTSVPTLTASVSVVTPLVSAISVRSAAGAFNLGAGSTNYWQIGTTGTIIPIVDNARFLGAPTNRISIVFATAIDSGTTGALSLSTNTGTTQLTIANNGLISLASGGTISLGGAASQLVTGGAVTDRYDFYSGVFGGTTALQFQILGIASANRNITVAGSNGGNPTIGVTAGSLAITPAVVAASTITHGDTNLIRGTAGFANNAAAQVATITNGPTAGNPTKWIPINDNGTTRNIPAW